MTPLLVCAVWLCAGLAGAPLLRRVRHRRASAFIPVLAAAAVGLTSVQRLWPGPAGRGGGLVLGRPGAGLLILSGLALAAAVAISPTVGGDEMIPGAVVGAAMAIVLSATSPLIWAAAIALAVGALVVRWLAVAPGRSALAAGRVAGVGAAALVGSAPFLATAAPDTAPRSLLAGTLLAVGVAAVLAVVPLGGWAAGCLATLRALDFAPWVILLTPAVLISTPALMSGLSPQTRETCGRLLLIAGLAGAVWGGVVVLAAGSRGRYGRVLLADLALGVAALGTGQAAAASAILLLILVHLCAAPLLLHTDLRGVDVPRRLTWLALSGVPLTPGFWARFLVLEACAAGGGPAVVAAAAAAAMILVASVAVVLSGASSSGALPITRGGRWVAWAAALGSLALGFAPQAVSRLVFGTA
ncbi:MAG: hypothetical protein ABR564_01960 [Candidatus Dormibacteria bacterium]